MPTSIASAEQSLESIKDVVADRKIDIVFPVLHGNYGEDGTVQGLLELMRVPYVGCGVAASAVCMDKVLQKNVCSAYQIPVVRYFWLTLGDWRNKRDVVIAQIFQKFEHQYPLFIKPANQGSSVGITKAHNELELHQGIADAFTRDTKVIIEAAVPNAQEIECAVMGRSDSPVASVLGEIIPGNEFYDYAAKYLEDNSQSKIPAALPAELTSKIRATAQLAFQVLDCWGLARVDFLVNQKTGEYYLNELNTMPGFTPISMYPKLWQASGVSYSSLLDKLVGLALERFAEKQSLNLSR